MGGAQGAYEGVGRGGRGRATATKTKRNDEGARVYLRVLKGSAYHAYP